MRVLLTDHQLVNGYTLGLASGLRADGVEVSIGAPAKTGVNSVTAIYPRSGVPNQRIRKGYDGIMGTARFQRLLATTRPDVLHIQWPTTQDAAYAIEAKRICRLPLVYTVHNPVKRINDYGRGATIQRRLIRLADLVLVHGPSMRELIVDAHRWAAPKTHMVELGNYEHMIHRYPRTQARAQLNLPADVPLFVFVGQLQPRKGVDLLLEAFVEYRRQGGAGHLLLAGVAPVPDYEQKLREMAHQCGPAVHWLVSTDFVPQETIDLAISSATLVTLPFQDASQSASLILAMTHGRCVVSSDVGEVSRTLGDRGILIKPGDRQNLLKALALGEHDQALCDELGDRARRYTLSELSWTAIGKETHLLYRIITHSR
jgi:glycosyltransferase involved in cell wall biosynthesis